MASASIMVRVTNLPYRIMIFIYGKEPSGGAL